MLSLPSCANSCLICSLNKLSLFKVNFTQTSEKGCIETTLFPNKIWDLEWEWKTVFPNFGIGNGNQKQYCQVFGLGTGIKNSVPDPSWERND